jgi:hypothetical protein
MNALVKKEIHLLLPGWSVAMLLAMVQGITQPYDFYVAMLLFFGLTIMALTTIGREASLNTFSSLLLAQPAERIRVWKIKLSVLAGAFLTVFLTWLVAFGMAYHTAIGSAYTVRVDASDVENSYNLFITICLIAAATFTGGLWTTLLLRQLAGAFWLTLLVPATLSGFSGIFLADSESSNFVIAVLSVVIGVYSIAGFLFARWLFLRAQDVGWSGGIIELPEWKFLVARADDGVSPRNRRPILALIKKEFQLHQASLTGAAGLLVLHIGIIVLRTFYKFERDSAGAILSAVFWILWLVMAPVIGSMAVAEERRLNVLEGQLCLPVSRRVQFVIKAFLSLFLATLLGGVMPVKVEKIAAYMSGGMSVFTEAGNVYLGLGIVVFAAWLALVSFFASTLARSFLQAIGFGVATFFCCTLMIPVFTGGRMLFLDSISRSSILPLIIAVPTIIATLLWLAYFNFNNYRDGWALWRRNVGGLIGAVLFIFVSSNLLYYRAWEIIEPAELAHGPAKLSLANPPNVRMVEYNNLLVRLPDGRIWFDRLGDFPEIYYGGRISWKSVLQTLTHPLRESIGPRQFLAGSNWLVAATGRMSFAQNISSKQFRVSDFLETVGIQADGTLWLSGKPEPGKWTPELPGKLQQYGSETNWCQLAHARSSIVLLKTDGTLWRWGGTTNELHQWPGLRAFTPHQIGTNSDWQNLFTLGEVCARQTNGSVWRLEVDWKIGKEEFNQATNLEEVVQQTASSVGEQKIAFVRADGTLWVLNRYWDEKSRLVDGKGVLQVGKENDWRAVAVNYNMMVALKADSSLWQWNFKEGQIVRAVNDSPVRLGIHDDWVAIANTWSSVTALAADGSLWLWPDRKAFDYGLLIRLPKQPEYLGNVLRSSN